MQFKQWLESFGGSMNFIQKWAPKHPNSNDIDINRHGMYASFGYGMHHKIQDPATRAMFLQSIPSGTKVVQVDQDGESLYRVLELPDGSFVAEKNVPHETAGWVNIPDHELLGFPSSWANAVQANKR